MRFTTAAALVNELLEARDDQHLLRVQKQLATQDLLFVDELGYVPLSKPGAPSTPPRPETSRTTAFTHAALDRDRRHLGNLSRSDGRARPGMSRLLSASGITLDRTLPNRHGRHDSLRGGP